MTQRWPDYDHLKWFKFGMLDGPTSVILHASIFFASSGGTKYTSSID
jgi:hypothetical protein